MNKLKTVDSKVLSILKECPETRFDDMKLKLISLSTCEYSRTNGRLVVVAKLVK